MTKYSVYRGIAEVPIWITVEVTEGITDQEEFKLAEEIYDIGDGQEDWSGAEYKRLEWEEYYEE